MHRRRFLAHALHLPAAVAALPLVGGLAAVAQEAEQALPDVTPAVPEMATIPAPPIDGAVRLLPDINQTLPTVSSGAATMELAPGYWVVSGTGQTTFSIVGNTIR